ncbi:MAG TPA: M28 family peptidase [Gemmatimonadaceae bacterium]|nr:M28 family peptidase [Gemmatimonadaceae bacterium]
MRKFGLAQLVTVGLAVAAVQPAGAQEREDRTLLNWAQLNAIANEASGERAQHNVLDQVAYQRVHPLSDYGPNANFHESRVVERLAKEYGFSTVSVESFPTQRADWQPTVGQLWLQGPAPRKLFDIYDTPVALASGSLTGDVTAEVVNVGNGGRAEDYAGKDVRGKIVLGSASTAVLQRLGVFERGAVGVLSYNNLRLVDRPDAMLSQSIAAEGPNGAAGGFAWSLSPRVGLDLVTRIDRGDRVMIRSVVDAKTFPGELEVVHATIPGDGSTDQVVFVSAHLYEGYIKQGANDDNSGVGLTLEMGRAYLRLVEQGLLPRPKRTIHFLWVPEFSGTYAWLDAHPDVEKRAVADLNFDMEGIGLAASGSFWVLHRTPDTFPTFLNDIAQSFMETVAETNRERVRFRANGYAMSWPLLSQNGSRDPFYIKIDKHYGASDHVAYMQRGIPSVMFITWPDPWYHSSQDTPDKLDPTQFKRAAVVGIGAMTVLASADDAMAYKVANESFGRGAERLGANQRKGLAYLADATSAAELVTAYKEAKVAVRHQAEIEKAVLMTASTLFTRPEQGKKTLAPLAALIDQRAAVMQKEVTAAYRIAAGLLGAPATEPAQTEAERQAARTVVTRIAPPAGQRGPAARNEADRLAMARVPQHMNAELALLLAQGRTVLEIRDFLAGEFDPLPLEDLMANLRAQERAGGVTLSVK